MRSAMLAAVPKPVVSVPLVLVEPREPFTSAEDGLPVYHAEDLEHCVADWDVVHESIQARLWSQAAIAAQVDVEYGKASIKEFAERVGRKQRWIRGIAKTYRTFENGKRLPNCDFGLHYLSAGYSDPYEAIRVAQDQKMTYRELERWIKLRQRAVETDEEEDVFEDQPVEDESVLLQNIELAQRLLRGVEAQIKSPYVAKYITGVIEELDWELCEVTKAPAKISQRVLSLVLGGCQRRDQIAKRARLTPAQTDQYLQHWAGRGRIEEREEGGRKQGQKGSMPTFWVDVAEPRGNVDIYRPKVEYADNSDL